MREILFRGKRVDNGKWVQGDFVSNGCGIAYTDYLNEYGDIGEVFCKVIPKTVGQYTGLTDKNGKKIFEGDIVFVDLLFHPKKYIGVVVYAKDCFAVDIEGITPAQHCLAYSKENGTLEVIGNIHDNPELLKGGADNV
jgi:uncharacterized phage protein (TIGR01671 family)